MREKKFRQAIFLNGKFHSFHYWGFLKNDNNFVSPQCSDQEALNNSQEYTGLKDKNSVEIYEGDVVDNVTYGGRFVIEWGLPNESYAGWTIKWIGKSKDVINRDLLYYSEQIKTCKVIGNIFQNPELLKKKS